MTANEDEELLARAYALSGEEESKALYRDWAGTYEKTMLEGLGYLTPGRTVTMMSEHLPDKDSKILDIGAGTGLAGKELAKFGYHKVHALDYSPEMLAEAEKSGVYIDTIVADLNQPLPIHASVYDGLICTGTFTHAHVGAACFSELDRILKSGGIFACTVHFDVWQPKGFEVAFNGWIDSGKYHLLAKVSGRYFEDSADDEGWFIVVKKL